MEAWREAWRLGFGPVLPLEGLRALRDVLREGDPRCQLTQGRTVFPPPENSGDWPVEAACAVGYCGWRGEPSAAVREVSLFFCDTLVSVHDKLPGGGARHFLNWFDCADRQEVLRDLLPEVELTLAERGAA